MGWNFRKVNNFCLLQSVWLPMPIKKNMYKSYLDFFMKVFSMLNSFNTYLKYITGCWSKIFNIYGVVEKCTFSIFNIHLLMTKWMKHRTIMCLLLLTVPTISLYCSLNATSKAATTSTSISSQILVTKDFRLLRLLWGVALVGLSMTPHQEKVWGVGIRWRCWPHWCWPSPDCRILALFLKHELMHYPGSKRSCHQDRRF